MCFLEIKGVTLPQFSVSDNFSLKMGRPIPLKLSERIYVCVMSLKYSNDGQIVGS